MKHIHYSYAEINAFLVIFWVVTFFAELPSGFLADTFGRINTFILSCITRSIGLLFLFFDTGNGWFLMISGVLTALGDSFYSGTLDSWFVDKAKLIDQNYQIDHAFSLTTSVSTGASLITGFIGAQYIANINLSYPILAGAILLLVPVPIAFGERKFEHRLPFKIPNFKQIFDSKVGSLQSIKNVVKDNRTFFCFSLSFLPIILIVTGPYNQWQLFFQQGMKTIQTGWILVGVNLLGILGSYLAGFLLKIKKPIILLMLLSLINAGTIIFAASIQLKIVAVLFFLIHVLFTSSDEVVRYTILHKQIVGTKRTTLISFNNTLNAGVTVVVLSINGWLSDAYSIGFAWTTTALIGLVLTMIGYLIILRMNQKNTAAVETDREY